MWQFLNGTALFGNKLHLYYRIGSRAIVVRLESDALGQNVRSPYVHCGRLEFYGRKDERQPVRVGTGGGAVRVVARSVELGEVDLQRGGARRLEHVIQLGPGEELRGQRPGDRRDGVLDRLPLQPGVAQSIPVHL